jgi:L-malate glycosyltransferase
MVKIRILHISSYYIGNKLYKNLIKHLSMKGLDQEIFIPIRNSKHKGKNQLSGDFETVTYHYKNILKKHDRFLFLNKTRKQTREIEKSILVLKDIDFIHAHTLYSDGGTAYNLHRKYGIKYLINVRNTDINVFYKYGIHLRKLMYKILLNASAIVFISHAYKEKMFSLLPSSVLNDIRSKCIVIPNGIDDYWHQHGLTTKQFDFKSNQIALLFIGSLDKNKNLEAVVLTAAKLCEEGINTSINVVGEGPLVSNYRELIKRLRLEDNVVFHGYIQDKQSLFKIMDNTDILLVPSYKETFGLVYIEAMSRGIPVIYSKNQGIDGFFCEGEVGFSVDPMDINMIKNSVKNILPTIEHISNNCIANSKSFKWEDIANKYYHLYNADNDFEKSE